jgi:hypothetical protein
VDKKRIPTGSRSGKGTGVYAWLLLGGLLLQALYYAWCYYQLLQYHSSKLIKAFFGQRACYRFMVAAIALLCCAVYIQELELLPVFGQLSR